MADRAASPEEEEEEEEGGVPGAAGPPRASPPEALRGVVVPTRGVGAGAPARPKDGAVP